MAKRGRATKYTQALASTICLRLAEGESLRAVCADIGISAGTVIGWVVDDRDGFAARYTRATEIRGEQLAGQIQDILDTEPQTITITRPDGTVETKVDPAHVAWLNNRANGRKWEAAKLRPKVYGDKLDVEAKVKVDYGALLDRVRRRVLEAKRQEEIAPGGDGDV